MDIDFRIQTDYNMGFINSGSQCVFMRTYDDCLILKSITNVSSTYFMDMLKR